jgi:hypothetical protein
LQETSVTIADSLSSEGDVSGGYFTKLPAEVRESILILLPSKDVRSLCATVRAFAEIELSQKFWASRFSPGFEFDCILEARKPVLVQNYRSWKHLFFGLSSLLDNLALRNRKRIWGLLRPFASILRTYSGIQCDGKRLATLWEPHLQHLDLEWQCLKANKAEYHFHLRVDCRILFNRQVCLDYITSVYVSSISYLGKQYISGLRFLQPSGADVRLGYIFHGNQEFVDILGGVEVSDGLGGFVLAFSSCSISAILFISGSGRVSDWAGPFKGFPKRSILARNGSTYNLRADFDVSGKTP